MHADLVIIEQVRKYERRSQALRGNTRQVMAKIDLPDSLAWSDAKLVQAYTALLWQTARKCRVPDGQHEELVQEVWVEFLVATPRLVADDAKTDLRGWSFCVMRRRASNRRRNEHRHPADCLEEAVAASLEPVASESAPGADLEQQEELERVQAAVDRLRRKRKEMDARIIELHFWEDQTVKQIAATLGRSRKTVDERLQRALHWLKKRLAR